MTLTSNISSTSALSVSNFYIESKINEDNTSISCINEHCILICKIITDLRINQLFDCYRTIICDKII